MLSISYSDILNECHFEDIGIVLRMEASKDRSKIRVVQRDIDADEVISVTIHNTYESAWSEWDEIGKANIT